MRKLQSSGLPCLRLCGASVEGLARVPALFRNNPPSRPGSHAQTSIFWYVAYLRKATRRYWLRVERLWMKPCGRRSTSAAVDTVSENCHAVPYKKPSLLQDECLPSLLNAYAGSVAIEASARPVHGSPFEVGQAVAHRTNLRIHFKWQDEQEDKGGRQRNQRRSLCVCSRLGRAVAFAKLCWPTASHRKIPRSPLQPLVAQ